MMLKIASAVSVAMVAGLAAAQDAPLFQRPFDGVPTARESAFTRIVPAVPYRGTRTLDPATLASRFSETSTTPAEMGMTAGFGYFGQFVDHDLDLSLEAETSFLLPPFVKSLEEDVNGDFVNLRTPGLDLDSVYGFGPLAGVSAAEAWYDFDSGVGLRFRFATGPSGGLDFLRDAKTGRALIGDPRNDENGLIGQLHRAFQQLHNKTVDRILNRDAIDEMTLTPGSAAWWEVFHEARNYTTAYYQGIVGNDFLRRLTGRSLFDALDSIVEPVGILPEGPQIPLEFAHAAYRLHTIIPNQVQIGSSDFVSPIDPILRSTVNWGYLFGPRATPASRVDTFVPAELRNIVSLVIPGTGVVTLDLGQTNIMRGRETLNPSGEAYLDMLLAELGLLPDAATVRGKTVLNWTTGSAVFTNADDAAMLADLLAENTDLWVYVMAEASLNNGLLGPVGQDILERTIGDLLRTDDYSLVGANAAQFTAAQLDLFKAATLDGLIATIYTPGDLNNNDVVDAADLGLLLPNWGSDDLASDLDGDGTVSGSDLARLLANWSGN